MYIQCVPVRHKKTKSGFRALKKDANRNSTYQKTRINCANPSTHRVGDVNKATSKSSAATSFIRSRMAQSRIDRSYEAFEDAAQDIVDHALGIAPLEISLISVELFDRVTFRVSLPHELYEMGSLLAKREESITTRLQSLAQLHQDCFSEEDNYIRQLVREADGEANDARVFRKILAHGYPFLTERQTRLINAFKIQCQAVELRAQRGLIGDRAAIEHYARHSGFAREVCDAVDEREALIAACTERLDELGPDWSEAERDFRARIERGELVFDPLVGFVTTDDLRHVGSPTIVSDIAAPVPSLSKIQDQRCPICLDAFVDVGQVVRLPCNHLVDRDCLSTWINSLADKCNTCVICRRELFPRRRREPSNDGFVQYYSQLHDECEQLNGEIQELRVDSEILVDILGEIQPSQVSQCLGR